MLVQQKTVLDVFSEDAAVYLLVPQLHGHKLQVRDDLHQSSFVQLVLYGHAFDVRELQVLLQTGGQRGLGHAASCAGLASGPFVFLLRAETPATSKLGGTIRREKVVFIKVQLRAVQPHAGTREVGLKHQTREGGVITVQLRAVQPHAGTREGGLNTRIRREKVVFSRCSHTQSNPLELR